MKLLKRKLAPSLRHLIQRNGASVEHPVMVRAEDCEIGKAMLPAVLLRDYVGDIARCFMPPANHALISKKLLGDFGKSVKCINLSAGQKCSISRLEQFAVAFSGALSGTILRIRSSARVITDWFSTRVTRAGDAFITCPHRPAFPCGVRASYRAELLVRQSPSRPFNGPSAAFTILGSRISKEGSLASSVAKLSLSQIAWRFAERLVAMAAAFVVHMNVNINHQRCGAI